MASRAAGQVRLLAGLPRGKLKDSTGFRASYEPVAVMKEFRVGSTKPGLLQAMPWRQRSLPACPAVENTRASEGGASDNSTGMHRQPTEVSGELPDSQGTVGESHRVQGSCNTALPPSKQKLLPTLSIIAGQLVVFHTSLNFTCSCLLLIGTAHRHVPHSHAMQAMKGCGVPGNSL